MKVEAAKMRKGFAGFVKMAKLGEEIIILKHGNPEAKLIPFKKTRTKQRDISDIKDFIGMQKDGSLNGVDEINRLRKKIRHEIPD